MSGEVKSLINNPVQVLDANIETEVNRANMNIVRLILMGSG